jgi:hypothetical protein
MDDRRTAMPHPSGVHTAAHTLATAILRRVPGWTERVDGMCWLAEDPDTSEDQRRVIVATGQLPSSILLDGRRGPLVVGVARGVELRVQLPHLIDGSDIDAVIGALAAFDVIPSPVDTL